MMVFFIDWLNKKNTIEEAEYIHRFLETDMSELSVFKSGDKGEIGTAIAVINSVPIEEYIKIIDENTFDIDIVASQVPQFSSFSKGAYRVPELLEFAESGLNYSEIGYQLSKATTDAARMKYGENHAKLAQSFGLVEISSRPSIVKSTSLGKYLLSYSPEEKNEFLKRMILREYIIKKLIHDSAYGEIQYRKIVNSLSDSTAYRRSSNVKKMLEFALCNTNEEKRINRIDWTVKYKKRK